MIKKAVIFDLDGTLLDTLEDLADSLNYVMEKYSCPVHTIEEVRGFVGNGIRNLVKRAVPAGTPQELAEEMYQCYIRYYKDHCMIKTKPYEGITDMLKSLRGSGIRTAVLSNKADSAVQELTQSMFSGCFDLAMGAKDGIELKPARAMMDIALKELSVTAADAVYVGDSDVDIQFARNSEMDCVSVTWGFRSRSLLIESGASVLADSPAELLECITRM